MRQQKKRAPLLVYLACLTAIGCGDAAQERDFSQSSERTSADSTEQDVTGYVARAYSPNGSVIQETELTGIIGMREVSEMVLLADAYYDDGQGNLVWREAFELQGNADVGEYALTFLRDGGIQLALDFQADRVVDAVFDVTPEGRIGVIGHPALEAEIDCVARRITEGEDPLAAVDACLGPGRASGTTGGGSGVGAPTGSEYDRLAEPNCSSGRPRGGPSDAVAYAHAGWQQNGPSDSFDRNGTKTTVTRLTRPNEDPGLSPDELVIVEMENPETGHSGAVIRTTDYTADGTVVTVSEFWEQRMPGGVIRRGWSVREGGRVVGSGSVDFDEKTGECLSGDCEHFESDDADADANESESESEPSEGTDPPATTNEGGDPTEQPDPDCELHGDCPFTDPRCESQRNDAEGLWDCVARTGNSPMECLARIRDGVTAATGCVQVAGPSGQAALECPPGMSPQLIDCLAGGGNVGDCMEGGLLNGGAEIGPEGSHGDDVLQPFRNSGESDVEYVEISGLGAIFLGLCNEGVEQLCTGGGGALLAR